MNSTVQQLVSAAWGRIASGLAAAGPFGGLMLVLSAAWMSADAWHGVTGWWDDWSRPGAHFRGSLPNGVSVSLSALERSPDTKLLPAFAIKGVLFDPDRQDWVLFGNVEPGRPQLPVDAIAIAVRALRLQLEAPGIDIGPGSRPDQARVTYFGGVADTVVGAWLFRFDHWMKRLSLGEEAAPVGGVPVYWNEVERDWERKLPGAAPPPDEEARRNRFWLCSGNVRSIENDDALVLEEVSLRVLTEPVVGEGGQGSALPCTSSGNDDTVAVAVAAALTARLDQLQPVVPISQIGDFTRLLAGLSWLMQIDPYRDLRPWTERTTAWSETPLSVPVITRGAETVQDVSSPSGPQRYRLRLEVSGGVTLDPQLIRTRSLDDAIERLSDAIFAARPLGSVASWRFAYTPEGNF